jgi:hypothetical protein
MPDYQTVLDDAMNLSRHQRADLISALIHSLEPSRDDLPEQEWWTRWITECERRLERYERGQTQGAPWRESLRRAREAVAAQREANE